MAPFLPRPHAFMAVSISLAALLQLSALPRGDPSPTAPEDPGCDARLVLLAPCAPFVEGAAPAPSDACCRNLNNVFRDRPGCLCPLLDRSGSLPVNRSLVLQLPLLCRLDLVADANADACPGLSLPPLGSPPSQTVHGRQNTSSSSAVSPAMAMPTPRRASNLLLGLNRGGKMRAEKGSAALAGVFFQ